MTPKVPRSCLGEISLIYVGATDEPYPSRRKQSLRYKNGHILERITTGDSDEKPADNKKLVCMQRLRNKHQYTSNGRDNVV